MKGNTIFARLIFFAAACLLAAGVVFAPTRPGNADGEEQRALVEKARVTLDTFMKDPDMQWLRDNLKGAIGLMIVPELVKGGLIFGGTGGGGVLLLKDEKTGEWSQPAFYSLGSVTFGLQIGGEVSEVLMMVNTTRGAESYYSSSFKLGGDASVAAGPTGVGAKSNVSADIISFSRTKGAYAGVSLEGAVVKARKEWNKAYYGKDVSPVDILVKKTVSNPDSEELRSAVAAAAQ